MRPSDDRRSRHLQLAWLVRPCSSLRARIAQVTIGVSVPFILAAGGVAQQNSSQWLDVGFTAPMFQYRLALRAACHKLNLALREEAGGYHGNEQDLTFAQAMVSMGRLLDDSWLTLVGFHYW